MSSYQVLGKRLKKIAEAKNEILTKSSQLIRKIKILCEKAISTLNEMEKNYQEMMKCEKFFKSDIPKIENIDSFEFIVQDFNIEDIEIKLQAIFEQEMLGCIDKLIARKNRFLNNCVGGFWCGAFSEDGKFLVTGGMDCTVRGWDYNEKKQIFLLQGHYSDVRCLALTKDFHHIVSGSFDYSVRIWSVEDRNQVALLKGHENIVQSVCLIEAVSFLISGDGDGTIIIWNYAKHNIINKIKHSKSIFNIIQMKTQATFLFCSGNIMFYDIDTMQLIKEIDVKSLQVECIAITNNEEMMVSGSNKEIIIWDINKPEKTFEIKTDFGVSSLALSSDNQFIISGLKDIEIVIWNMQTGNRIKKFINHNYLTFQLIQVNENYYSISQDSGIGKINIKSYQNEIDYFLRPYFCLIQTFTIEKKIIGFASGKNGVIFDLENGIEKNILIGHDNQVHFVEISNDQQFALTCCHLLKDLFYWDLKTNQKIGVLKGHTKQVLCVAFSHNALNAASGSIDFSVRLWNLQTCIEEYNFEGHNSIIWSIKFLNTKQLLASVDAVGKLIVWDLMNKTIFYKFEEGIYSRKILLTEEDKYIILCGVSKGIVIFDLENKRLENKFEYEIEAQAWLKENKVPFEYVKSFIKP